MKSFIEKLRHYFTSGFGVKKVLLLAGILSASLFTFFLLLLALVWAGAFGTLPDLQELTLVENPSASEVYSADSVLLGRYFIQERSNIHYVDLPEHVVQAAIATEDTRFYDHHGIDLKSLGRVMIKSLLLQRKGSGGGSTITQQLAKNLYPRKKYLVFPVMINKMREMIIATRLESVHDKKAILTLYLNTIPFGDNTYGLEAAAQRFFSVPVNKLSIDQGAVLIGMLKATHHYNPRIFPDMALQRRNTVLAQMARYGMLERNQVDSLQALPITLRYNRITHHTGLASYFREYIRAELLEWCTDYNDENKTSINLYTDGLKIYTTIDSRLQRYAEGAITSQMAEIQKKFLAHWGKLDPWYRNPGIVADAIMKSGHYQNLLEEGFTHASIMEEMQKPVLMNMFTWAGEEEMMLSPVDSIKHYLRFLNAGLLAIDPQHSAVRVWVGGINHSFFQYDHVRESTKRQVGSTFKPIVYAAALEQGVKPCAFISAEKTVYSNMEDWAPENAEDNYNLKYSMAGALVHSVNTVSVRVLEKAGIANTITLAHKMGIISPMKNVPSLALGTADISMMEMVSAYACFATKGKTVKPFYITRITTHQDEVLEEFIPLEQAQALSQESAQMILHMLRRSVNEGTGSSLRSRFGLRLDIAGKTGTTQSNADGWFIGITPKLVIGAWVGADNPAIRFRTMSLGQGASTALPIVGDFLVRVGKDKTRDSITQALFPALPVTLEKKLLCDFYKTDRNLFRRFSGRTEIKKNFGEKKKGFFKKLFEKKGND